MKVLLLYSSKTKGGTHHIRQLLEPEIEVDSMHDRPADTSKYDGIILHNRLDAKPNEPTAIYACSSVGNLLIKKKIALVRVTKSKPRAIWTNSHTVTIALKSILKDIIPVRYMAKPGELKIPDKCPPFPKEKRILWWWCSGLSVTKGLEKQVGKIIVEFAEDNIEICMIGDKQRDPKGPMLVTHPNVTAAGRIDIPKEIHNFSGMVRITSGLDYGRSTYQILAYGRWCLYMDMYEPYVVCAESMGRVPELVRALVEQGDEGLAEERRKYIQDNFSEDVLRKRWQDEVREVFG